MFLDRKMTPDVWKEPSGQINNILRFAVKMLPNSVITMCTSTLKNLILLKIVLT